MRKQGRSSGRVYVIYGLARNGLMTNPLAQDKGFTFENLNEQAVWIQMHVKTLEGKQRATA